MKPTRELIDALFREEVERAREMTPEEKLLAGPELFDFACGITMDGIRHQFPEADDAEIDRIMSERLALLDRLEAGD